MRFFLIVVFTGILSGCGLQQTAVKPEASAIAAPESTPASMQLYVFPQKVSGKVASPGYLVEFDLHEANHPDVQMKIKGL